MIARFGSCEVDFERVELRVDGELVAIEPQVFDVIAYLVEHRDRLVTKEELLDTIWGERFVSESALTSRIKSARQAVGDDGRRQAVIKTAHGRGYRFVAEVDLIDPVAPIAVEVVDSAEYEHAGSRPVADVRAQHDPWPLVGRHDELELLGDRARDPACSGVLITGPAGIGKTRLAREAAELARDAGRPVETAHGHPDATTVALASLSHLLPPDVVDEGTAAGDLARSIVFLRARSALEDLAGEQRLVLVVENADQLDELSTALVASLAGAGSIFTILTQRTGRSDPLVLEALVRSGQIVHLDLDPLDDTDLDILLYRVLEGPIDLASLERLSRVARGRPGALRQLVDAALATGALGRQEGVWRLTGPIRPTVAALGHDHLDVGELPRPTLDGAEVLAVATELDLDVASEILGTEPLDALDALGLLAVTDERGSTRVSLAQPHVAVLLRDGLGPLRSRRIKTRLVAAMSGADLGEMDRLRMVSWAIETGSRPDRDLVLDAARLAVAIADAVAADIVLDHLDANAPGADVSQLRAELLFRRGQIDAADELLHSIDRDRLDARTAATVVRRMATIDFHVRGRFEEAIAFLEEHEGAVDADTAPLLGAHAVGLQAFLGRVDRVLDRAASMPDDVDLPVRLELLRGRAGAHLLRGDFDRCVELAAEHVTASAALPPAAAQAGDEVIQSYLVAAHAASGRLRLASDLVHAHLPLGRRTMLAWLPIAAARLELDVGRPRAARALISTPLAAVRSQNLVHAEPLMTALVAHCDVVLGHHEAARDHLAGAVDRIDDLDGQLRFALVVSLTDVWIALGEARQAIDLLAENAARARSFGALVTEAHLSAQLATITLEASAVERVEELAATFDGELWPLRARYLRALVDEAPDDVFDTIAAAFRELGAVRDADRVVTRH